eukprot:1161553-Pelagomonas_calceolata.AAC.10
MAATPSCMPATIEAGAGEHPEDDGEGQRFMGTPFLLGSNMSLHASQHKKCDRWAEGHADKKLAPPPKVAQRAPTLQAATPARMPAAKGTDTQTRNCCRPQRLHSTARRCCRQGRLHAYRLEQKQPQSLGIILGHQKTVADLFASPQQHAQG